MPDRFPAASVNCKSCAKVIYEGDEPPEDGQAMLTEYADRACTQSRCPHKIAATKEEKKKRNATVGELDELKARIAFLESKAKP